MAIITGSRGLSNGVLINGVANFYTDTKPTTRINGSALVIGDRWQKITDGNECFWNGTYWLGTPIVASSGQITASTDAGYLGFSTILAPSGSQIFIEFVTASYFNLSTSPSVNYYNLNLITRAQPLGVATVRATIAANSASSDGFVLNTINTAFTVNTSTGNVTGLACQSIRVGTPTANTDFIMAVQYRRIH